MIAEPEIAAAEWLAGVEYHHPGTLGVAVARAYRAAKIKDEGLRAAAKPENQTSDPVFGCAVVCGANPWEMARVKIRPGRAYGWVGREKWPSFVWPESERRRIESLRAGEEPDLVP